jgi:hypothetical protein
MNLTERGYKPLNRKAYGSIGHIVGSRLGPGDHSVNQQQSDICTIGTPSHFVYTQTKLDGTCVAVAKLNDGSIVALNRAGYTARSSPHEMHHLFADWVDMNVHSFDNILYPGERIVGEWLAQAHGTIYNLKGLDPFVAFDLMRDDQRAIYNDFLDRVSWHFAVPDCIPNACDPWVAMHAMDNYGADQPEGVVYRVEINKNDKRQVAFLAKWVHPKKIDGKYLKGEPIWNWRPQEE